MARLAILVSFTLLLPACLTNSSNMNNDELSNEAVAALIWIEKADPLADAEQAVRTGDFRVYAQASRGQNIPGVTETDSAAVRQNCGTRVIPGSTDAVRGTRHLELLQKAYDYAEIYNRFVIKHCTGE